MGLIGSAIDKVRKILGKIVNPGGGGAPGGAPSTGGTTVATIGGSGSGGGASGFSGGSSGGGASGSGMVYVRVGVLNNPRVATYATYLERGWVQTVTEAQAGWLNAHGGAGIRPGARLIMVPRPTFATAAQQGKERWRKMAQALARRQSPHIDLEAIATVIGADMQSAVKEIIATGGGFAERRPLTLAIYAAELAGDNRGAEPGAGMTRAQPLVKTGEFLGSIAFEVTAGGGD